MQCKVLGLDWKETDFGRNHTCYSTETGLIMGRVSEPYTGTNYSVYINQAGVETLYGSYINLRFAKEGLIAKFVQDVNEFLKEKK